MSDNPHQHEKLVLNSVYGKLSYFSEREASKTEVRQAITAIQNLIDWSKAAAPRFQECITCGTPTFESVIMDGAVDSLQFFKDLLL